ncbi:CHAT domain-containing protein [bacterium]|nr:MAG: CHAT domain-containing protein [bacterium]
MKKHLGLYLINLIFCLTLSLPIAVQSQSLPDSAKITKLVYDLLNKKEYQKALNSSLNYFDNLSENEKRRSAALMLDLAVKFYFKSRYLEEIDLTEALRPWLSTNADYLAYYIRRSSNANTRKMYFQSIAFADSALQLAIIEKDTLLIIDSYYNKAINWSDLNIPSKSIEICTKILHLNPELIRERGIYGIIHLLLGYDYGAQKNYQQSILHYIESKTFFEKRNNIRQLYFVNLNLGDLYSKMSRFNDAEYYIQKALYYSKLFNDPSDITYTYRFFSGISFQRGQFEKASMYADSGIAIALSYKLPYMVPGLLNRKIAIENERENFDKVQSLFEELETYKHKNLKLTPIPDEEHITYLIETQQYERAQNFIDTLFNTSESVLKPFYKSAFSIYLQSKTNPIQAADSLDNLISVFQDAVHTSFSKNYYQALYSQRSINFLNRVLKSILIQENNPQLILKISEFIKGVNSRISDDKTTIQEPDSIIIKRKELEELISKEKLVNNGKVNSKTTNWQLELDKLNQITTIQENSDAHWTEPTIHEIQSTLSENTAFIHLLQTKTLMSVLVIDKTNTQLHSFNITSELQKKISKFKENTISPERAWDFSLSDSLTTIIFGDLSKNLKQYKHLAISSDGILSDMVFSALSINGAFLAETMAIQNISTFEQILEMKKNSSWSWNDEMLLVSNPEYPTSSTWGTLPFSKIEASSILELNNNVTSLSESSATKNRFSTLINENSYRYIHIAAHGVTDTDPNQNRIIFSYKTDETDGVFFPNYLAKNQVPTDLVVLSACETANGVYITGEGLWSMQKAWFIAGAKTVVASLWKINDKSSAEFMHSFYSELSKNDSFWNQLIALWDGELEPSAKLLAFNNAQKTMIKSKRFNHPYFWAAYQYYGL